MKVRTRWLALAVVPVLVGAARVRADSYRETLSPAYVAECGSCHIAFPARGLDAASWRAVLDGLDKHFGVDASLDAKTLEPIRTYLESGTRREPTAANGKPLLRLTETRWFRHEHAEEVPASVWRGPGAVKPADCAACHSQAATGDYSERSLRLPGKGEIDAHERAE